MNIGYVSTWLERGATYVTKTYIELLHEHNAFVYARGGEYVDEKMCFLDAKITYGYRLQDTEIHWPHFKKWIIDNKIQVILFNEQDGIEIICKIKKFFKNIIVGSYIDYYKENEIEEFGVYDFLLCNTLRHYSVFNWHKGAYYIPWGTNLEVFNTPIKVQENDEIRFFHSMGMSQRKGTSSLIKTFIDNKLFEENCKLIIHSQVDTEHLISKDDAKKYNIEIINKSVGHPGLYHTGDIYVYPTTLDGLGLTIYEALASGLPVIATDVAPMNEIIKEVNNNGKLVKVKSINSRSDGYFWPLTYVCESDLAKQMRYYIDNRKQILNYRDSARQYAINNLDIKDRANELNKIFESIKVLPESLVQCELYYSKYIKKKRDEKIRVLVNNFFPNKIKSIIRGRRENKRRDI